GYENILWAFQIGFVGSLLFGLIAIDLVDVPPVSVRRCLLASASLIAALMCSGVGLIMLGLVGLDLLLDRARRGRLLWVTVAPVVAYGVWDVLIGARAAAFYGPPVSIAGLLALRTYLPFGVGSAAAGLLGLSTRWEPLALVG